MTIDIPQLLLEYEEQLQNLSDLTQVLHELPPKSQDFARSLISQFETTKSLSPRQWPHVENLLHQVRDAEPVYGDFSAVWVMLQFAASHIKVPKIRLVTNWQDTSSKAPHRFIQLSFKQTKVEDKLTHVVEVHVGGWQGSGYRKFAGWIKKDRIIPYSPETMTVEVKNAIQDFALDPQRCSLACANIIGACVYCNSRLTDDESKTRGYGPVCADHYNLPWGSNQPIITKPAPALKTSFLRRATAS